MPKYASQKEADFAAWVDEALRHGVLSGAVYQPKTFVLCEKQTVEGHPKATLRKGRYTPDWVIYAEIKNKASDIVYKTLVSQPDGWIWVDVKGSHPGPAKYPNTSFYTFPVKQKWLFREMGIT